MQVQIAEQGVTRIVAALASDTWGCEVRPNESEPGINQPWHWITIPMMGMTMGEIFYVKDLADHLVDLHSPRAGVPAALAPQQLLGWPMEQTLLVCGVMTICICWDICSERPCERGGMRLLLAPGPVRPGALQPQL